MKPSLEIRLIFAFAGSLLLTLSQSTPARAAEADFENACGPSESWTMPAFLSPADANAFQLFLKKQAPPIFGFSQGLALRQFASSEHQKALGEYWIARSLYESKLIHVAHGGFSSLFAREVKSETALYQLAALDCLLKIQFRYPTLELGVTPSSELAKQLNALTPSAHTPYLQRVLQQAAGAAIRMALASPNVRPGQFEIFLSLLKNAGPDERLARGLIAARFGNHRVAATELEAFVHAPALPDALKRYVDHAHLLASRAQYTLKNFKASNEHLKAVKKSSNELADTLSELAWANLMDYRYDEAIGTAMNLESGGLRRTFAPEAPMVMAMAMNELCQYQDSIRSVRLFKKHYEPIHRWLSAWNETSGPLYEQVLAFLEKRSKVPDRIGTEWLRSPVFISHQDELNLILDETAKAPGITQSGSELQHKMAGDILESIKDLKPRFKLAKMSQIPGEGLPRSILRDLDGLKRQILDLRRLQRAAPVWHKVIASQGARNPARKATLIAGINRSLAARTQRMILQLDEIAENIQMVEIEIYNGASHDIIWQSAHPEYKKLAAQLPNEESVNRAKIWDWGKLPKEVEEEGEIWEDELGSFKANLFDNCASKDRYLALIKRGRKAQ